MFCTNCGKELNPGDRFCANCGCEIKASQSEKRQYDNVVFNPPFRMEADKRTAQILKNREEFSGFNEIAKENSRRNTKSKGKMDWNLDGFPESITAKNKSGFDWGSVVERRNSGRAIGYEKIDLVSTLEHKRIDDTQIGEAKKAEEIGKDSLGLPPEDSRVISLEELEKELYDLEEDLKTDTAGTNQYQAFDVENDDELDAYLDGISKTKKPEKDPEEEKAEAEALAAVKMGGPMRWNLNDDTPKGARVSKAPMGLVWGIDPDEVVAKRKAAKIAAKKNSPMVWNTDSEETVKAPEETHAEEAPKPESEVVPEPEVTSEVFVQPEPETITEPVTILEPESADVQETAAEPETMVFEKPVAEEPEKPSFDFDSIEAPSWKIDTQLKEEEPAEEPFSNVKAETAEEVPAEEPFSDVSAFISPEKPEETPEVHLSTDLPEVAETPAEEVESEFNDMILNDTEDDLEKTRMIDHSEIKRMLDEYKKRLEEERNEQAEEQSVSGIVHPAASIVNAERPPYQEELIHPWEAENITEEQSDTAEEKPEDEFFEKESIHEEPVEEEPVPEESIEEEPVPKEPIEEEPVPEEPAETEYEETDGESEEPADETELILEEMTAQEEPETPAAEETVLPIEEEPMFYTFSRQNEAFQQLLEKERDRLNGLGTEYMPLNRETKVEKIETVMDKEAYEENGRFVEGVVQPVHTTVADVSGDAIPEVSRRSYITDGDWLRELRTAKDAESVGKVKKTYSQIFGDPLVEKEKEEQTYGPADDEEAIREKQKKAEEFDKFFKEEEETKGDKPKRHIVGNIIMILLILLILFEGSVLAAKLISPDSKYAHLSDAIVEKVLDLVHGSDSATTDDSQQSGTTPQADATADTGSYLSMVSDLSKDASTIGQALYSEELNYSMVSKSNFEGVESMETLKDSAWTDDMTYAGGVFSAVINYYDEWKSRNTDESLVGIDSLELGEIKQSDKGYYILTKTTFASKDGNKVATYQTCYVTLMDDSMFINEIKGETVNG